MGIELNYQALPRDSRAFKRALADGEYWQDFILVIPAWEERNKEPYKTYRKKHKETKLLFEEFPAITDYTFSLDRAFEGLNYILNPVYYTRETDFLSTFESNVIFGNEAMPQHARGTQGMLARYSDPEFVEMGSLYLNSIMVNDLMRNFDANAMEQLNLYKFHVEDSFDLYANYLTGLQEFYAKAAKHDYCILFIMD